MVESKTFTSEFSKHFFSQFIYSNNLELLDVVIHIFSICEVRQNLTKEQKTALRFYLRYGYSDDTKELIRNTEKITTKHLDQINFQLDKKKYLEKHPTNYRLKKINKRLVELKNRFLAQEEGKKAIFFTIGFKKKE